MAQSKQKNPLYVVTNKGKDVEQVKGLLDGLVKRLGLTQQIQLFQQFLDVVMQMLLSYAQSYPALVAIEQFLARFIYQLESLMARLGLGPVVEFQE